MSTILVVDDSQMVRMHVKRALSGAGFDVIEAADGVDALEKLVANPGTSMVVCDVNMPRMSGLEFLEALSKDASRVKIPVIMLTTEGEAELVQRAKALGAKGWIIKPARPEALVAVVKKFTTAAMSGVFAPGQRGA